MTATVRCSGALLAAGLVCAGSAQAQTTEDQKAVEARKVRYVCENDDRIEIATLQAGSSGTVNGPMETIDAAGLVTYGPPNPQDDVMRTGSSEVERRCGRFRIVFRGGYYNLNPQGELGAADDYPMAEIFDGARSLTGHIALGICDADNPRESYLAQCPDAWAERITVYGGGRVGEPARVIMRHRFDRELDSAPIER